MRHIKGITHGGVYIYINLGILPLYIYTNLGILPLCIELWKDTSCIRISWYLFEVF